ncbi:MAG: heme biosynthesis HemY N-terminal domain-containing protein [Pseudomonadota bacterium]
MIRLVLTIALCVLTAIAAVWLTLNPGSLSIEFLGWRLETSAALAGGLWLVLTFILVVLWRLVVTLWTAPDAFKRFRGRRRREQGFDALERALIASAAGQGELAIRQAARADAMLDRPALSRLLAARAAEAAGDLAGAEAQYEAMLEDPRTRLVARRGLATVAEGRGEPALAIRHAGDAFKDNRSVGWAFDALFKAQIAEARWADALSTLDEGEKRRHVAPEIARRRRAVLLTVEAMGAALTDPDKAAERAERAASIAPDFPPATAAAGRFLAAKRRHKRAAELLEAGWSEAPHPALAKIYAGLRKSDTNAKRAARLRALAERNPDHRETRLLLAEVALDQANGEDACAALEPLLAEPNPSARVLTLAARLSRLEDDNDEARRLLARAAHAPGEPDWSDIDGEGQAFAFGEEDWKRMVFVFGDEGLLIHPRHERYEAALEAAPATALLEAPRKRRRQPDAVDEKADFYEPGPAPDDPGVPDKDEG